ncbi:MAG: shikimate dehydrogenase [Microscillaceae bacterium]|jgi:shikimate dehydrogenase|nr:shikimate dehydrogenase [Microscillaceae bacterium]
MRKFGLIGYPLSHSFSKKYFTEKFAQENITDAVYELYELPDIAQLPKLLQNHPEICGLNVTIPHKASVIPYLNQLNDAAREMGAVNVIKIDKNQQLIGYNSDYYGFLHSLKRHLQTWQATTPMLKALVLGSGGAAQAVKAALNFLKISYQVVSRQSNLGANIIAYQDLNEAYLTDYQLIINTTPLGMYPNIEECPPIPYNLLTMQHFLYDLVYNPQDTLFLSKGKAKGSKTAHGLEMLYGQAEKAWEIWTM